MQKHTASKVIATFLLAAVMIPCAAGCSSGASNNPPPVNGNTGANTNVRDSGIPMSASATEQKNTSPINIVWYPNESSNTHDEIRAEVGRLVEEATGRKANNLTTTDYTIAIQSIASGSADIAMAMGAVGYIEAKNQNPLVDVLFVNGDKNGTLDEAKYFAWICVNKADADMYKSGGAYSIDNIRGGKMSFVSNSSTSGFRVPTSSIIAHFKSDALTEDDLLPDGSFFSEVYFGQSHQGSAINLVTGNAGVAAFCDIELAPYIQIKEGVENTVGAVYEIKPDADAPFDAHAGKEFVVIACTPVFNGPNAYNPKNLSADEIQAIRDLFTSAEVADNELLFYDATVEGAFGLYKKASSYGYALTSDSWYDPYRG
ncbi:MAG: PhnD/SsuA/transferrin family substrate-binding protein [Oscillospiraceae bacterium]|nr:PhnD/SsuA/transferrin family substrate-binding protein [Oscillospiraceae bacterium]